MLKNYIPLCMVIICSTLQAEVVLDGSLGPRGALPGPDYLIGADLGQQHGANLFHSFDTFNINTFESATFSGSDNINNVISRVTGGNPSNIDGLFRSTISSANAYLLNPAGILFGQNAQLDVQGSFHASTADVLHFQDGSKFSATHPQQSGLTVAPPAAFGFLTESPARIAIEGSNLSVNAGKTLSFVGGQIDINNASLAAPSGQLNLISMAQPGDVIPRYEDLPAIKSLGNITLHDSIVTSSGEGGGGIYIRGGRFELHNSTVVAHTQGAQDGTGIDIQANELLANQGGQIASHTFGAGKAGGIRVKVTGTAEFTDLNSDGNASGVFADSKGSGDAGDVILEIGELKVTEGAWMGSEAYDSGDGGHFIIRAKDLTFLNGGQVFTATYGSGQGGKIDVKVAEGIILSGEYKEIYGSGILSYSFNEADNAGNAGDIVLEANALSLKKGTQISAATFGAGQGGHLILKVNGLVSLSGENSKLYGSLISSSAVGTVKNAGNGGTIVLKARQLQITDGGQVLAATFGPGDAGQIFIQVADSVTLSGTASGQEKDGQYFPSAILTNSDDTYTDNLGQAGNIVLVTQALSLAHGAKISASTRGSQPGGNVEIQAQQLYLADDAKITAESKKKALGDAGNLIITLTGQLNMENASIETAADRADGGNIYITVPDYIYLVNSAITTSVKAEDGDGGNMTLSPTFLVLDGSKIIARAVGGDGGNIHITTQGIYEFSDSPIDASSELGVDGEVVIALPDASAIEGAFALSAERNAVSLPGPPCRGKKGTEISTFSAILRREGASMSPKSLQE